MAKRKVDDDEWELFKDTILDLYDKHPLSIVIDLMYARGLKRTKAQYERRLKLWRAGRKGTRINITSVEWEYIFRQIRSREVEGRKSGVTVRGFKVPQSRLAKQGKIHTYRTALQRYASDDIQVPHQPQVEVYTPPEQSPEPPESIRRSVFRDSFKSGMQRAARDANVELVKLLISMGDDVNDAPVSIQGATALQFAAMQGNFEIVDILLKAGADINTPPCDWDGRSAIEGAAELGRVDMVQFLLKAGADVQNRTNMNYRKTVYRAWAHGHRVLAKAVQQWKQETYGLQDCESIENIIESMDLETLEGHGEPKLTRPEDLESCLACKRGLRISRSR